MVIHRRANLRCQSRAGVSVIPDSREVGYKSYDMLDGAALGISDLRSRSRIVSRGASASYDQIEHIDQIQEKELISGNILSELSAIGHDAVNGVSNDTAASEMVSLNGTVGIVGNMQNACGNAPSTVDKDGEVDIRMWVRAEELKPTTVHCDLPCSEVFQMSGAATTANSNDNVPADALAKAFNYDRKDIEDLSLSERHVLKEALGRLETMQSRKARFVRGWLYYFSLQGLPNSEYAGVIRMNRATIIQQDALAVVNQAARNNTAYAYCNMAHDQAYITFLYIISRKFGIAPGMLRRDSKDGGNEYFRARLLDIPDEADAFCVVCNTTPTNQMIGNAPIDIDSKIWHSYMVNYASSINANEMLSETKAIAMAAIYAEYLPSMHLEKQVSVSELCQTCAVTETFSTAVPLEGLVAKQVIGSVTCCLAILIKYRDLISNESVRVIKDGVPESYSNNMLGRPETRARIYSMIEREGLVGGAKIMAVMDVLNVIQNRSMNARKERLCNIPMVNLWATQPSSLVDFKSVIKNSISSTLVDFQWLSRARRREIRNTKTRVNGAINAVLAQMDIYTNVEKAKGVVFPRQSNINVDIAELDYVDKCLMEGKTTFVRVSRKITTRPTGSQSAWEGTRGSACKIGRLSRVKITLENDMSVDDEIMPGPIGFNLIPDIGDKAERDRVAIQSLRDREELIRLTEANDALVGRMRGLVASMKYAPLDKDTERWKNAFNEVSRVILEEGVVGSYDSISDLNEVERVLAEAKDMVLSKYNIIMKLIDGVKMAKAEGDSDLSDASDMIRQMVLKLETQVRVTDRLTRIVEDLMLRVRAAESKRRDKPTESSSVG